MMVKFKTECKFVFQIESSLGASQVAQWVKNLPAMQETWVWYPNPGQEDPLEEGMATHSNIPAWRVPWTEEPGGLQSIVSQGIRHDWAIKPPPPGL